MWNLGRRVSVSFSLPLVIHECYFVAPLMIFGGFPPENSTNDEKISLLGRKRRHLANGTRIWVPFFLVHDVGLIKNKNFSCFLS